ncbi:acylphosphatase [Deferrisoma camini]|uniref:acylphosphatase n=1 Tax=Deferrisoma camini TaxID=1035120 RepID=UPI00046D4AF4|nr:acylphosphatase [Deferrisoma camini]
MDDVRAHVVVSGRVQGVWFRASTRDVARRLGLRGWVRNVPNGDVEAVFEGPRPQVEEAIAWCRRGPPAARVDHCDVIWEEPRGEGPFEVRF